MILKKIGVFLHNVMIQLALIKYHTKRYFKFNVTLSELGTIGEQLRYGQVAGGQVMMEAAFGASEVIKAASGRFVKTDGAGYMEIADSGDSEIIGFAEHGEGTTSSTDGGTKAPINISLDAVYKIPIGGAATLTRAMFYDTCDLIVASNIQGADLTSSEDVLIIVGGDLTNNKWILVKLNPLKMGVTGCV